MFFQRRGTVLLYSIIILGILAHPMNGNAYSYAGMKWTAGHADYWLDIAGWDPTLIIYPALTWRDVVPSPFYFTYKGHTIYGYGNLRNEVTRFSHSGGIATTWTWYSGSSIVESDTVFNMNYGWGCCGEPNLYDVKNTMTHEFGHWLKLNDLYGWPWDAQKTMYAYSALGETKKRTLETDDINGINNIYP